MGKWTWIIAGLLLCILLIFGGGLLFTHVLQKTATSLVLSEMEQTGLDKFSLVIRKLDLFGMDVADIQIGGDDGQGITIDTIQADFSPGTLFNKKIKHLSINGIRLVCRYRDGAFSVPGIYPFPEKPASPKAPVPAGETPGASPAAGFLEAIGTYGIETIELSNITLSAEVADRSFQIPMEAVIRFPKAKTENILCDIRLFPFGQNLSASVAVDRGLERIVLTLAGENVLLDAFASVFSMVPDLAVSGYADIGGKAQVEIASMGISHAAVSLSLKNFYARYKNARMTHIGMGGEKKPVVVDMESRGENIWKTRVSSFSLLAPSADPMTIGIKDMTAGVSFLKDRMTTKGGFTLLLDDTAETLHINNQGAMPLAMGVAFDLKTENSGNWEFTLANPIPGPQGKWNVLARGFEWAATAPALHFIGNGAGGAGKISGSVSFSGVSGRNKDYKLVVPLIRINGSAIMENGSIGGKVEMNLSNVRVTTSAMAVSIPNLSMNGETRNLLAENPSFRGNAGFSRATAAMPSSALEITGGNLSLPLAWPCLKFGSPGEFSVGTIKWDKKEIGGVKARIRQKETDLFMDGKHHNRLIQNLIVNFSGESGFQDGEVKAWLTFGVPSHDLAAPVDLGTLFPQGAGMTVKGNVSLSGEVAYDGGVPRGRVTGSLDGGSISKPDMKFTMAGVAAKIDFTDLFQLKSAPQQVFSFASADIGDIQFQNGKVEFQVESKDSFFIEKTLFNWCGGHVETHALRIVSEKDVYDLVLYCDRLNLAMILLQFGAADADGKGTVSGRIPMRFARGRWIFNDGFLYSSPGEGGRIKIQETETWASAIPPNTPEYDQIQLARAAMQNYDYNWARVGFHTEGNDLLLKLSFNGQPTDPIPFRFHPETGRLMKITAEGEGIRPEVFLNLNFRLPLDEVLHYREFLDMIQ